MVVDENIFVMLLVERFRDFINDDIADSTRTTEAITCVSAASREDVDATIAKAIAAVASHGSRPSMKARCTAAASRNSTVTSGN